MALPSESQEHALRLLLVGRFPQNLTVVHHDRVRGQDGHLERLAAILRSLTPGELDTLELLLDRQARTTIQRALKELDRGEGIPLEKW